MISDFINIELISIIIFFAIVGFLLYKNRKKMEFHSGLIILRWKKGLELIDILVKKHEKSVRIAGYVAVVIGFLGGLFGLGTLIFTITKMTPAIALVLPTAGGYQYPGPIIGVPFWYWLIAFFVIMFFHETMHGIFARAGKVPLKNYGILLFFVLPIGAFVDPDNDKLKRMKTSRKLPLLAAGSFGNFIVSFLLIALILIFNGFFLEKSVAIYNTTKGYPAYDANVSGIIKYVNGIRINTGEELSGILNNTAPGKQIDIVTNIGTYNITTVSRPDNQTGSYIGISSYPVLGVSDNVLSMLFVWLIILNSGIAIANLLPWKPFDGGLMAEEVLTKIFKNNGRQISNILSGLIYALTLFSLFGVRIIQTIF